VLRIIKTFVRRVLSVFGYAAVDARWPQQIQEKLTNIDRELAETKSGVSTVQGESGQSLSHIVVLRQELAQLLRTIRSQASATEMARPREVSALDPLAALGPQMIAIPRQLERKATHLAAEIELGDLVATAPMLAQHYLEMADHVVRHWIVRGVLPADPYPNDDLTFAYAKQIDAYIAEADAELDEQDMGLPWRFLWSDRPCSNFLVLGNATAANHGAHRHTSEREVYSFDFLRVRCRRAADPLPGATGTGGSAWSRLGDRLIEAGLTQRVMFVPLAVAGSQITDWIPGGVRHRRIALALSRLRKELMTPMLSFSAVLWHLGDAPALSHRAYRLHCHDIIADLRSHGIFAPVFIASANENRPIRDGTEARINIANPKGAIFAGPSLDPTGHEADASRKVDVDRAAALWFDVLSSYWPLLA
jgi:hypothetical protein